MTQGGKYTLQEILLEQKRRLPTYWSAKDVTTRIVELASSSTDGLVTYGDLWKSFNPAIPWEGHKTLRVVANALGKAIYYCVTNRLPIVTVLVVRGQTRRLSTEAITNIYQECKELGVDVGLSDVDFVQAEIRKAMDLLVTDLPDDK